MFLAAALVLPATLLADVPGRGGVRAAAPSSVDLRGLVGEDPPGDPAREAGRVTSSRVTAAWLLAGLVLAACAPSGQGGQGGPGPPPTTGTAPGAVATTAAGPAPTASPADAVVVVAAGDIATCDASGDEATAALVTARPNATVLTLGDNAYDDGSAQEFNQCYQPTWGAFKDRTRPAAGNHDYGTSGAAGYFGYFGPAAGGRGEGYYSYDLGAWHVVALNSNCSDVRCFAGSEQEQWLRADLAANNRPCTLAYWHHPRFSSGERHGSSATVAALWQALYDAGADVVLAGHEHNYERLGPLNPSGDVDPDRGVRSFVVGTGGKSHYPFRRPIAGSEVRNDDTYGVLQLTLRAGSFDWEFVPQAGGSFTDSGSAPCH